MPARPLELTGRVFGKWTVLERAPSPTGGTRRYWLCRCECGTERVIIGSNLTCGSTTRCRICHTRAIARIPKPTRRKDMTGEMFGKWMVLAYSHANAKKLAFWVCVCECGTTKAVGGESLRNGRSMQCASCAAKDRRRRRETA